MAAQQARELASSCAHPRAVLIPGPMDPIPGRWVEQIVRVTPMYARQTDLSAVAAAVGRPRNHVRRELESTDPYVLANLLRARRAVLVEGPTDRAVFEVLLQRSGLNFTVVAAHGKVQLAALRSLAAQLGVATYVIFDGDAGPLPAAPSTAHRVRQTRRTQTLALTTALPCSQEQADWSCGDPGSIGPFWCAWEESLETELSTWPSFMAALEATGVALADKNHGALRAAAQEADLHDLPESFGTLIQTLRKSRIHQM